MSLLTFSLKGDSTSATTFVGEARQFTLVVDEPPALGGTDAAANPVEYLLASYAGCLNVVGHLVGKELGIKFEKLTIHIEGQLNPSRFLGQPTEARAGYQSLTVYLQPITDADPELLKEWLWQVKRRCPVGDNLSAPTPVNLRLVTQPETIA